MTPRRAPSFPAWAAALGVTLGGLVAYAHTVDDAFIVARYAERWASGLGYTMTAGPPTDGVTGPLWTLLLTAAVLLGLPPVAVAKLLGLASAALAAYWVVARLSRQQVGRFPSAWAASALAAQGTLSVWAVAGLETGLGTLLVTGLALELTRRKVPRGWVVGAGLALLAGLRPELALFGGLVLAGVFSRDRRAGFVALGIGGGAAALLVGIRLVAFGQPLPLSFYAKGGDLAHGISYVVWGLLLTTGGGGILLALRAARVARPPFRFLAAALFAQLLATAVMSGDWMPGFRLLAPILPAYALLAAEALRVSPRNPTARRVIVLASAFAVAIPAADLVTLLPLVHRAGADRAEAGDEVKALLVERCERVALVDIGRLSYGTELELFDLAGVTDPEVARLPGGHLDKPVDASMLLARDVDCVLLHSSVPAVVDEAGRLRHYAGFEVEERLVRELRFIASYRVSEVFPYAPRYHYVLLERRPKLTRTATPRSGQGRESPLRAAATTQRRPSPRPGGS